METPDPLLERISPVLAAVPGVAAVVLGGSRASGAAHSASDTDIGLYFSERAGLDVGALLEAVKGQVDDPSAASITEVGGWGPWIVGGGWLTVAGKKVDLLYRPIERIEKVISDCRDGRISMDYQPGHPAWLLLGDLKWAKSRYAARFAILMALSLPPCPEERRRR